MKKRNLRRSASALLLIAAILPAAAAALGRGEFSLQRLVAAAVAAGQMRVREIGPEEAPLFENWNAPADVRPPPQA